MRVAVIIACHKDFEQVSRLCEFFSEIQGFKCFVHIDKKATVDFFNWPAGVSVISGKDSINVKWGHISQVESCLLMLGICFKEDFDYYWYMSGQDLPIKKPNQILSFFENKKGFSFLDASDSNFYRKRNLVYYPEVVIGAGNVRKFLRGMLYFVSFIPGFSRSSNKIFKHGSQWFCLHKDLLKEILHSEVTKEYLKFYRNSFCSDESFFQTLCANEFADFKIDDYLTYIDWSNRLPNPKTLTMLDFADVISSEKLLARKFDCSVDSIVIDEIYSHLKSGI